MKYLMVFLFLLPAIVPAIYAGEAVDPVDPMTWTPPADVPLFVERIPTADFPKSLIRARGRAAQFWEERSKLPDRGLLITKIDFDSAADKAGLQPGDVLLKLDEHALTTPEDVQTYRSKADQSLSYFSVRNGAGSLPVKPGKIGIKFKTFNRDNPMQLDVDLGDPRWGDELRIAGLVYEEDPDFAETVLARAVAAGLPRNEQLEFFAARLAMSASRYEIALAIAHRALPKAVKNAYEFGEIFFIAAISSYKLEAALEFVRKSDDPEIRKNQVELERLVAAHKALPDEIRLAAPPSVRAAILFPEDLMLRAEMLTPLKSEENEHKNDQIPFQEVRAGNLTELCSLRPWRFETPGGRYDYFAFVPAARNAHFSCTFTTAKSDALHTRYDRLTTFSFFDFKPEAEKTTDAQITSSTALAGVEFFPDRTPPIIFLHPIKIFGFEARFQPVLADPEQVHQLHIYAMGQRIEIQLDGRRILYAPYSYSDVGVGMRFWYGGTSGELQNVTFCDMLTRKERETQVNPNINMASRFGWTRLHRLVQWASPDIVTELLMVGANPNLADLDRQTPLMLAIRSNRLDIVKILVQHGAHPETPDSRGRNAYKLAIDVGCKDISEFLLKLNPALGKSVPPSSARKEEF